MEKYLAYVAIDFGTSGSSFSYWFPNSNTNKENIKVKKWEGTGTANKIETEIILDENFDKILAFGRDECEQFMHSSQDNFLYFSNVKMYLYKNQEMIKEKYSGKEYDLVKVISKFLIKLRNEAIEELQTKNTKFHNMNFEECLKSIRWIITVPAIWSERNKTCMIKASKLARLISDDSEDPSNFFALEPEGAACYYTNSDNSDKEILKHPYIICDIGGGTTDITTHERIEEEKGKYCINELYPPVGGADGSREINKYIFEELLIKKLFSQEAFDNIQKKIEENKGESYELKEDMRKIDENINKFKETFSLEKSNKFYSIKFEAFKDGFAEEPQIKELVEKYNQNIKDGWKIKIIGEGKKWTLGLPYKILYDLFQDLIIKKATKHIQKIIDYLKNKKNEQKEIKSVILAGGATANKSIVELFRKELSNLTVVSCDDPEIAVVRGAIYFAINPFSISKRIARFSLGVKAEASWIEKLDNVLGAEKIWVPEENKYLCSNRFIVFYKKNHPIDVASEGKKRKLGMNSESCTVQFYKSDFDGPIYVVDQLNDKSEPMTEKFGELQFTVEDFDEKECDVEIEVKLGGTFISSKITYLKTGKQFFKDFSFK